MKEVLTEILRLLFGSILVNCVIVQMIVTVLTLSPGTSISVANLCVDKEGRYCLLCLEREQKLYSTYIIPKRDESMIGT